jgi:cold shock CspA family protein
MSTRRSFRKKRVKPTVGETGLKGKVVINEPGKPFGFIDPDSGAARIIFYTDEVPYERGRCVGVGETVYFTVARQNQKKIKAVILGKDL